MTLFFILFIFLVVMFMFYFDYMLGRVRVIIMFMQRIAKRSLLCSNGVSGRHCISMVLIRCLLADAPYISNHVVNREGDSLVGSSVVHLPSIGQVVKLCSCSSLIMSLMHRYGVNLLLLLSIYAHQCML